MRVDTSPILLSEWIRTTKGDGNAAEHVINHVHIVELFFQAPELPSDEQAVCLGETLKDMWTLKLRRDFPHLDVQVAFDWDEPEVLEAA